MHFGFEPGALLADADLVIAIDADAPWIPSLHNPPAGCHVAHMGEEPFYRALPDAHLPERSCHPGRHRQHADGAQRAIGPRLQMAEARIAARRARLTERMRNAARAACERLHATDKRFHRNICRACIGEAVGTDAVIFNEYSLRAAQIRARKARHAVRARSRWRPRLGLRRRIGRQTCGTGEVHRRNAR